MTKGTLMPRFPIIILNILLLFFMTACAPQDNVTPTPQPLPTAHPIILDSSANIQQVKNALPASISYGSNSYGLYSNPESEFRDGAFRIDVFYGGDRMFGGRIGVLFEIAIFSDVDEASHEYSLYRTSPEWTASNLADEGFVNDAYGVARYSNVVLAADAENIVASSIIRGLMQDIFDALESPRIATTAGVPVVAPTPTEATNPFGTVAETSGTEDATDMPSARNESESDFFSTILNILRDNAWSGIGAIIGILALAVALNQGN